MKSDQRVVLSTSPSASFTPLMDAGDTGDVVCEVCSEKKMKAVKACLTCNVYYCESHVRQHYTVLALQKHILVDVNVDLNDQVHHSSLEDFTKILKTCTLLEHSDHEMDYKKTKELFPKQFDPDLI